MTNELQYYVNFKANFNLSKFENFSGWFIKSVVMVRHVVIYKYTLE